MRVIKFRGKSIETGEWAFGHLFYFEDGRYFISPKGSKVEGDDGEYPAEYILRGVLCLEVVPETVAQYTEIKDKNKKDIYDGAIAEVSNIERFGIIDHKTKKVLSGKCNALIGIHEGHTYIWLKVPYSRGILNIGAKKLTAGLVKYESEGRLMTSSVKVIGNIQDNPELI